MIDAGMPSKAITLLERYYITDWEDVKNLKVFPDPNVEGTFAIRVTVQSAVCYRLDNEEKEISYTQDIDLLWNKGDYDECEFSSWPPSSNPNNLQFFI